MLRNKQLIAVIAILISPPYAAADFFTAEPTLATPQERAVQQTLVAAQGIKTVAEDLNRWLLSFDLSTAYLAAPRIQTLDGEPLDAPQLRAELLLHLMPAPGY